MASIGQVILVLALLFSVAAPITLFAGHRISRKGNPSGERFTNAGYLFIFATTLCLSLCVALLIYCFFAGNYSIVYVAENHSSDVSGLAWLYKLAGLWSGREGSLLFWAWLISLFASYIGMRRMTVTDELSNIALAVTSLVLAAFLCVISFSTANNPFQATPASYLDEAGNLVGMASYWGMNVLLEHWAMTIHPPTLFIGYAGFTIPFAYAIAALIVNDPSKKWVELCNRITVFSWLFLGLGIGLGAVWAYVVLGWGGYWGWDPVENASLLPWLVGVALIHSFTIYRKRGGFKRWAVMCACICFSAVILGTFITRSGLVESVHAFEGDPVSLTFFLALLILSIVGVCIGIIVRRKDFEASEEIESLTSKNAAYYFNNVLMIASAAILAYLTI
ncbi:MAG: cytochrome c biogenesis protein CcsA, partial [Actinobacteria bacterium]|nr:cytochrome c biogenesis protein CcsA [Actinomycetota bacterium]